MDSDKKRLLPGREASSQEGYTCFDFAAEVFKVAVLGTAIYFMFQKADWAAVFSGTFGRLLQAGLIALAYHFGKEFSNHDSPRWRNYLTIFYGAGIIAALAFAGYGTVEHEGGYVETVFEFTDADRATAVAKVFFMLLIPGWYGVYKGKIKEY
jgi:putative copper export protein